MIVNGVFKVLDADGRSFHGGTGLWPPGVWRTVNGPLKPCANGLHLCRERDLVGWLGPVIWRAEYDDSDVIECADKLVVRRARVVSRVQAWDERAARLFAVDCAERVLPLWEENYPGDKQPREAVETARRYVAGEAAPEELAAAGAATSAATRHAASAATSAAASAAAWAAAWAAASAAAWAATRDAARDAADAARDAEREWQTNRLMQYLDGVAA